MGLAPEMGLLLEDNENEAQPHPGQRLRSAGAGLGPLRPMRGRWGRWVGPWGFHLPEVLLGYLLGLSCLLRPTGMEKTVAELRDTGWGGIRNELWSPISSA